MIWPFHMSMPHSIITGMRDSILPQECSSKNMPCLCALSTTFFMWGAMTSRRFSAWKKGASWLPQSSWNQTQSGWKYSSYLAKILS